MAIEEYSSAIIPVFITLGSLGILYPYFVEGFILSSFVLLVALFLLAKVFEKIRLKGYYDILAASLLVIFALAYFQSASFILVITGILMVGFALYSIFVATQEIKCAY